MSNSNKKPQNQREELDNDILLKQEEIVSLKREIDVLNVDKSRVINDIGMLNVTNRQKIEQASQLDAEILSKTGVIEAKNVQIESAQQALESLTKEIRDTQKEISLARSSKATLEVEVVDLTVKLAKVTDEYNEKFQLLLGITERSKALDQREDFIKGKYRDAGITYQPIK